jgi:hypothetical protein
VFSRPRPRIADDAMLAVLVDADDGTGVGGRRFVLGRRNL